METRYELDPRTLGALFLALCDEMTNIRYVKVVALLLELLAHVIDGNAPEDTTKIQEAVQHFIASLHTAIKARLAA